MTTAQPQPFGATPLYFYLYFPFYLVRRYALSSSMTRAHFTWSLLTTRVTVCSTRQGLRPLGRRLHSAHIQLDVCHHGQYPILRRRSVCNRLAQRFCTLSRLLKRAVVNAGGRRGRCHQSGHAPRDRSPHVLIVTCPLSRIFFVVPTPLRKEKKEKKREKKREATAWATQQKGTSSRGEGRKKANVVPPLFEPKPPTSPLHARPSL